MTNAVNYPDVELYKSNWTLTKKYLFCAYTSLMFLGIGEIGPVGVFGTFVAFIVLNFSFTVNNFLLGEFANLMN